MSAIMKGTEVIGGLIPQGLTKLWENQSPTTAFAAQNINVSTEVEFKSFLVEFRYYSNSTNMISPTTCAIGYSGMALFFGISGSGKVSSMERDVTPTSITGGYRFAFTGCGVKELNSYGSAPSTSTDNNGLVPLRIWGIA